MCLPCRTNRRFSAGKGAAAAAAVGLSVVAAAGLFSSWGSSEAVGAEADTLNRLAGKRSGVGRVLGSGSGRRMGTPPTNRSRPRWSASSSRWRPRISEFLPAGKSRLPTKSAAARPQSLLVGRGKRFSTACAADGGSLWAEYEALQRESGAPARRALVWLCANADCGGIGNQMRGLAVAFYIAVVTKRAFFVQWKTGDVRVTDHVLPQRIDWRLPADLDLRRCVHVDPYDGSHCTRHQEPCRLLSVVNKTAPCLVLRSNAVPSVWWGQASEALPELLAPLRRAIAKPDFLLGCALNFLFNFSSMARTFPGLQGGPSPYVALHMRLGDIHMKRGNSTRPDEIDSDTRALIREALLCARSLGESLFAADQRWTVFFASDSTAARRFVFNLDRKKEAGVSVRMNVFEPLHVDVAHEAGVGMTHKLGREWGDFLTIMGAQGLVSAGAAGASSTKWNPVLLSPGISDYSQAPAQYMLMPLSRQRLLLRHSLKYTCVLVSPKDLRSVL